MGYLRHHVRRFHSLFNVQYSTRYRKLLLQYLQYEDTYIYIILHTVAESTQVMTVVSTVIKKVGGIIQWHDLIYSVTAAATFSGVGAPVTLDHASKPSRAEYGVEEYDKNR